MWQKEGRPRVRVLHASPDAPALDLWVNGTPIFKDLCFGQSTGYADLDEGRRSFRLYPAGANGRGKPVVEADHRLEHGTDYTVAAPGRLRNTGAMTLVDNSPPLYEGLAMVRCVHVSLDAPALDIELSGAKVLFKKLLFSQATLFEEIGPGTYGLIVREAGAERVLLSVRHYRIMPREKVTFVALGLLAGAPHFRILPIVDEIQAHSAIA